ncbi:hypothetical protein ACPV5S_15560 [Vibrio astriarenae]
MQVEILDVAELRKLVSQLDSAQKAVERAQKKHDDIVELMRDGRTQAQTALDRGDIDKYGEVSRALVKAHKDVDGARESYEQAITTFVEHRVALQAFVALPVDEESSEVIDLNKDAA